MATTRRENLAYGDRYLLVQVPEQTRTVVANPPMGAVADIEHAVRDAITNCSQVLALGELGPDAGITFMQRPPQFIPSVSV